MDTNGTNGMGQVPSLPESMRYFLHDFGASGTSDYLVLVVPDDGITDLRDKVVYV